MTAALATVFMFGSTFVMLGQHVWLAIAGVIGIATSIAFVFITQYYTSGSWRPVQEMPGLR